MHLSLTSAAEDGKLQLTLDGSGRLDVREQLSDAGNVLPPGLKLWWESVCGSASGDLVSLGGQKTELVTAASWFRTPCLIGKKSVGISPVARSIADIAFDLHHNLPLNQFSL